MGKVETGGASFPWIRENRLYYADKTLLVKDILDTNPEGAFLFTRPRGFGKSINITMLDAFFNIEYAGNTWFDGLGISEYREYDGYRNAHPVAFLRLPAPPFGSYGEFMSSLRSVLADEYERHGFIFEPGFMTASERNLYETITDGTAPPSKVARGVLALSRMMERHYGRRAVILIDGYDQAMMSTSGQEHPDGIGTFIDRLLITSVRENPHRHLAYVTGTFDPTGAGSPAAPGDLWVDDGFGTGSGERFGFTESEVRGALEHHGIAERFDEVRKLFDGRLFGHTGVYNPSEFMAYVSKSPPAGGCRWIREATSEGFTARSDGRRR